MTGDKDRLKQYLLQTILGQIINKNTLVFLLQSFTFP